MVEIFMSRHSNPEGDIFLRELQIRRGTGRLPRFVCSLARRTDEDPDLCQDEVVVRYWISTTSDKI